MADLVRCHGDLHILEGILNRKSPDDSENRNTGDMSQKLYIETPLVESFALTKLAGYKVYLKLENLQPSDSFKLRGISSLIQQAVKRGCKRLVSSSGGNAGLAAAYTARCLKMPITVYVPETTSMTMVERIRGEGATVIIHGSVWNEANKRAEEDATDPECALIHPFDMPEIWEGHASIVEEINSQLGEKPDVIVASVGGGGLMNGIVIGTERVGWTEVPLVAMETEGADCFNQALKAKELVTLPTISSIAKSLGALTVSQALYDFAQKRKILSEVVTDKEAIEACVRFADDHRMLVEPSCAASLAAVYSGTLKRLHDEKKLGRLQTAVVIVCGGHAVTLQQLADWQQHVGLKQ